MTELTGRIAVVTGAARGMGRAFARRLGERGADVVGVDVLDCSDMVADVQATGRRAMGLVADISSPERVAEIAGRVRDELGEAAILVNNAGLHPVPTPFE